MQQRYYAPYEVAQHCSPDDCWVSCAGWVLDVTQLVKVRNAWHPGMWHAVKINI